MPGDVNRVNPSFGTTGPEHVRATQIEFIPESSVLDISLFTALTEGVIDTSPVTVGMSLQDGTLVIPTMNSKTPGLVYSGPADLNAVSEGRGVIRLGFKRVDEPGLIKINHRGYKSQATTFSRARQNVIEAFYKIKRQVGGRLDGLKAENRPQIATKGINEKNDLSLAGAGQVLRQYLGNMGNDIGSMIEALGSVRGPRKWARMVAVGVLGYLSIRSLPACTVPPAEATRSVATESIGAGENLLDQQSVHFIEITKAEDLVGLKKTASQLKWPEGESINPDKLTYGAFGFYSPDNQVYDALAIGFDNEAGRIVILTRMKPLKTGGDYEYELVGSILEPEVRGDLINLYYVDSDLKRVDLMTNNGAEEGTILVMDNQGHWITVPGSMRIDMNNRIALFGGVMTVRAAALEPTPTPNPFGPDVETVVLADGITSVALSPDGAFLGVTQNGLTYKANEAGVVSRDGEFFTYNHETNTLDIILLPKDATFTRTDYGWVLGDNNSIPIYLINNNQLQTFNKNNRVVIDNQAYQWNSKTSLLELVGQAGLSPEGELAYTVRGEVYIKGFDNPYTLIKPEKGVVIEGFTDLSVMGWGKTKDNKWVIYDNSLGLAIETINKEEMDRLKIKPGYENYMNDETFLARGFFVGYEARSIALDPNKPEGDEGNFIVLKLFVPNNGKGKGVILEYLIVVGVGSKLSFGEEFIGNNKFVITQDGLDQLSVGDYLLTAVADPDKRVKGIQELGFDYYDSIGWSRDVIIQIMEYCKNNPDQPNTAKRIYDMGLENVIIVGEGSLINYFAAP